MGEWILILMLVGRDGHPVQVESVAQPFATADACNFAGSQARTLPVLTPPGAGWIRVDWVCVHAGGPGSRRDACGEREEAKERIREEFRKAREDAR